AGASCGVGDGLGYGGAYPLVEGQGDDVVGGQFLIGNEVCQSLGSGHLHLLVDVGSPDIEGAPEDAGESQDVVHLVGEVGTAGGDDLGAASLGLIRENFRGGVGAGEHDGILVHGLDHLGGEGAGGGHADEH